MFTIVTSNFNNNNFKQYYKRKFVQYFFERNDISWQHCVDDVFVNIPQNLSPEELLNKINIHVPRIKSTSEKYFEGKLSFKLDIPIINLKKLL